MTRTKIWQPIEDDVLREGEGLPLDALCNAVNSLRRSKGMADRTKGAVGRRCEKLGIEYKESE